MKRTLFITAAVATLVILSSASWTNAKNLLLSFNESPLQVSQPDALDLYIERLAFAESSGREDIVITDTNGKKSYGLLQFQEDTWERYCKKYGIHANIMDASAQRWLARKILLERGGYRNWYTSVIVKGLGSPPID